MSLFRKKEIKQDTPSCACSCGCAAAETLEVKNAVCCIKVLGAGCASCHTQYENVKEAVKNMRLDIEVEYITDIKKVMEYGVMSMPAIVINENVVSMGKILKVTEVEKLLKKAE